MDVTFLTDEQIWGGNALQVMKDYGTKTGMSDLAVLLGGALASSAKTSDEQRSGYLWSASSSDNGYVRTVYNDGVRYDNDSNRAGVSAQRAPLCHHRWHLQSSRAKRGLREKLAMCRW